MRKPLSTFVVVLGLFSHPVVKAQDAPVFSQFFANPFQFNPSYAAHNGFVEANIFYRKQWLGIENAPTVGAFNIQAPVGRNVSLGFSGYSNKTVLLTTNAALGTFAYRINLGAYHHLDFGLSGGISFNNFDLVAVANLNDPALANVVQKSQFLNGQFGSSYQLKNFSIGFALLKLLDSKPNSLETFDKVKFNPFKNRFASVSYNYIVQEFQITPTILFRAIDTQAIQSQLEGMVLVTYKKTIWVGASFRQGYGLTGFIGMALSSFRAGYAYEHPTSSISKAANASHEIYLGARLGRRDRNEEYLNERKAMDSLARLARGENALKQHKLDSVREIALGERKGVNAKDSVLVPVIPGTVVNPQEEIKQPEKEKPLVEKEPEEGKMEGYYVVFGAYQKSENAIRQMESLKKAGLVPLMIYNAERDYYYVYTFRSSNKETALAELRKVLSEKPFSGAWLFNPKIE